MADGPSTTQAPDPEPSPEPGPDQTLDGTLDVDIDMDLNPQQAPPSPEATVEAIPEPPPAPTKKDISLREFLSKMDDYAPIVCLSSPLPSPSMPQSQAKKVENKGGRRN